MTTINFDEISIIAKELRIRAAHYDKKAEIANSLQGYNEQMSFLLYRLSRELNDVLEGQAKTIRITYETGMEG